MSEEETHPLEEVAAICRQQRQIRSKVNVEGQVDDLGVTVVESLDDLLHQCDGVQRRNEEFVE